MLADVKELDPRTFPLEDAVGLHYYLRGVLEEFSALGVDPPEWLPIKFKALKRHITAISGDQVERKLKEAKYRLEQLKTPEEQREELECTIKALEAKVK